MRRFGGEPVAYGPGLEQRVRDLAPDGVLAALDCVGTDEAVDVSLALVADRDKVVTIAARSRAAAEGFRAIAGTMPASQAYRDGVRAELAGRGQLVVPMAGRYPLEQAMDAVAVIRGQHPGGKLALIPWRSHSPEGPHSPPMPVRSTPSTIHRWSSTNISSSGAMATRPPMNSWLTCTCWAVRKVDSAT